MKMSGGCPRIPAGGREAGIPTFSAAEREGADGEKK